MTKFLRNLEDDRFYLPDIKLHSLEKIRRHNYYAQLFATGMKKKWAERAYIGLYSGARRARVVPTGEIVEDNGDVGDPASRPIHEVHLRR